VEHPDPNRHPICEVLVDSGGVATSSTRSRRWIEGGRVRHHLINPFTGEEAQTDLATVTVFAADAWRAEAHATAALLGSADSVVGYLDSHDLTGLAVASDGAVLRTGDLKGLKLALPELAP
jgi:thiamine biosynthesis lipoprotein